MAKKPKIKDCLRHISNSNEEIASAIRENNRLLIEKIETEQKKLKHEIETKDRVDISLKEYTNLKDENFHYKRKFRQLEELLAKIKVEPFIDKIIEPSLQVIATEDRTNRTTRVNIQFVCNGVDFGYDIDPFREFRNY